MSGIGLIGHTGFVGGTLARAWPEARGFNSANFRDMTGARFELLICAGVSAAKWLANADPDTDAARIGALREVLTQVRAESFVLISTIDIYADPAAGTDEAADPGEAPHAYGRHRRALEVWAQEHFPRCHIVRLPALFGVGLRKNALYDLLHDNQVDRINPAGQFQWYPTARLAGDIATLRTAGLPVVNLFTAPLETAELIAACFPGARTAPPVTPAPAYRQRTRHAEIFGGRDGYILDEIAVLGALARFVAAMRTAAR